jgi:hypothetical protein
VMDLDQRKLVPGAPRSEQKRARSHGNAGIPGIPGNVVCVTYRF